MMNRYFYVVVILLLSSCASAPLQKTNFYLLNQDRMDINQQAQKKLTQSPVVLQQIRMPEYLLQPNLVILTAENQIHHAQFERWAESLQSSVAKIIVSEMNRLDIPAYLHNENRIGEQKLFIRVDHFYPTSDSKVLLSGRFWLMNNAETKLLHEENFRFEEKLKANGYAQSVRQLRDLTIQLSQHLATELSAMN